MRGGYLAVLLCGLSATPVWAHSYGPPSGAAGDPPNNATCLQSGCHGPGTLNSHTAVLSLSAPARYVPGAAYAISIVMSNPQSARNGFETIPRRPAGTYDRAGSLAAIDGNTQVDTSGYGKHTLTGTAQTTWHMAWTAPGAGFGNVRFFAAGNASNYNSRADSGDWIETATANVVENLPPSAPSRNAPAANAVLATATPQLSVNAASDGNGDALTYIFQTCTDSTCAVTTETSPPLAGAGATVAWTPTLAGGENQQIFWRCRANDGYVNGPWMAISSYWIDAVPEPPGAPALQQPATGTTVYAANPVIVASATTDPDPFDSVDYEFTLAADAAFSSIVTYATHVQASSGQVSWQVPMALANGATYYLMVQGVDLTGSRGAAAYASFTVDLTHVPPTAPANLSPNGVTLSTNTPLLAASPATGTGTITYDFALDASGAFSSPLRSAAGVTAPAWTVPPPALADGPYYWRIRAFDGIAYSNFAYATFSVNAVNSPPGAPAPLDPLDGAQVNTRGPMLTAAEAVDPEGNPSSYLFEVAADLAFTRLLQASPAILPATNGTVAWTPASLANNTPYYWRVRARDAADAAIVGPYSAAFQLTVVNANLPPGAPVVADATQAVADAIVFKAGVPVDPDGDPVTLRYEVYADTKLAVPVTATAGVSGTTPAWKAALAWTPGTYYWRAQASDPTTAGPWSTTAKLTLTGPLPWPVRDLPPTVTSRKQSGGCAAGGAASGWIWPALAFFAGLRLRRRSLALLGVLLVTVACGDAKTVRKTVPAKADMAAVQEIFDNTCIGCHGGPQPTAGMSLEADRVAADLIAQPATNVVAADRKWLRVTPFKPEASFLMYKITTPPLGGGDRMPQHGKPLPDDQVEIIRRWIADGALH